MAIYILSILLGLVIGSFLNVVIFRTEKEKDLGGRSYCPKCKKQLAWHDNIPVISYLWLDGRCRFCRKKISIQYPLVELLTALVFLGCAWLLTNNLLDDWLGHYFSLAGLLTLLAKFGVGSSLTSPQINLRFFELIFLWATAAVLIAILVYDLKHMLIPDSFTVAGIIIVAVYNILADVLLLVSIFVAKNQIFMLEAASLAKKYHPAGIIPVNLSAFLGWEPANFITQATHLKSFFTPLEAASTLTNSTISKPLEFIYALITNSRTGSGLIAGLALALVFFLIVYLSRESWMGMGDVKLVFFLGFLLGIFKAITAVFLAFELGALLGIILIITGRAKMKTALPFGPFLIVGAILSLIFI